MYVIKDMLDFTHSEIDGKRFENINEAYDELKSNGYKPSSNEGWWERPKRVDSWTSIIMCVHIVEE